MGLRFQEGLPGVTIVDSNQGVNVTGVPVDKKGRPVTHLREGNLFLVLMGGVCHLMRVVVCRKGNRLPQRRAVDLGEFVEG